MLALSFNPLGEAGASHLGAVLAAGRMPWLHTLQLQDCGIGAGGARHATSESDECSAATTAVPKRHHGALCRLRPRTSTSAPPAAGPAVGSTESTRGAAK